ncbi:MAG: trypsin-like peptidase domain-containing protein [Lachnospiraceae bacterium]|nr:trypsin-like peptidase domain-containing protein [Lachnospiraceae bacterium]
MYENNNMNTGGQQFYSAPQNYDPQTGMPIGSTPTGSAASGNGPMGSAPLNAAPVYTAPVQQAEVKKTGTFGKIMMTVCMGLLFGLFAGVGFYAVNLVTADQTKPAAIPEPVIEQTTAPQNSTVQGTYLGLDPDIPTEIRVLTTEESDITEVVADVMPSMVSITEYYQLSTTYWGQTYTQDSEASGSGIIIGETDDEYIIVTNNHVISDADDIVVTFIDGTEVTAYLKGLEPSMDIGVISVLKSDLDDSTKDAIRVAELGDSDGLVLGQNVIAIGNALGYGQSVTTGIVSALNREVTTSDGTTSTYIQTDAAINPGNSGGALLNMAGQVIGINSNKIGGSAVEGMGYAIPITSVKEIIIELMGRDTLIEVDEENIGYIGIYMQEVTPQISEYYGIPVGIYVSEVAEGGGAEAAGIKNGDIIVGFQGLTVTSNDSLTRVMKYYAVGDEVEVTFMRNEDGEYVEHTVTVTLGEKPRG